MSYRVRIPSSMVLASLILAMPVIAGAELYRWVDERGVTNYSNQPPAGAQAARKMRVVENKVSVYTPDRTLTQAVEAARMRAVDDIRTGRRERQIETEWLARQYRASAQPDYVEPCSAADPRCAGYGMYPDAPPAVYGAGGYGAGRGRLRILPQIQLTPGATAGTVTGSTGFIPGSSAFAPGQSMQRPQRGALATGKAPQGRGGGRAPGGHRGR